MKNVAIKAHLPERKGDAFGCAIRAVDEATGVEFVVQVTVTGDGSDIRVSSGPYNSRKTEVSLGRLVAS